MKKVAIFFFVSVFILAAFTGCGNSDGTGGENSVGGASAWKAAYGAYLTSHSTEFSFVTLGLADFNTDGQPELVISDDSGGTLKGRYIILSYQNGEAVEVCVLGSSSSVAEIDKHLYFYRSFDSIHDTGLMYGYGFVSRLENKNSVLSITPLLKASIDSDYDNNLDELSRQLSGEESILKSKDFEKYLTIQKQTDDKEWQSIGADEYISLKNTYLGADPAIKDVTDYFKETLAFFDDSYNTRPITQSALDEFFNKWGK